MHNRVLIRNYNFVRNDMFQFCPLGWNSWHFDSFAGTVLSAMIAVRSRTVYNHCYTNQDQKVLNTGQFEIPNQRKMSHKTA